jgi:hypothetical protein
MRRGRLPTKTVGTFPGVNRVLLFGTKGWELIQREIKRNKSDSVDEYSGKGESPRLFQREFPVCEERRG